MLSRIGHNLFQMGCHLERAEQTATYTKVHFLSFMDASLPKHTDSIWGILLDGIQVKQQYEEAGLQLEEKEVLNFVALEESNPLSIRSLVIKARELARGARDSISAEFWEHINCFYHAVNDYSTAMLQRQGVHDFTKKVEEYSYILKGYVHTVMVRNDEWMLLSLGYSLERAIQVTRLLLHKMQEIARLKDVEQAEAYQDYHICTMLETLGSYEMYKQYYKKSVCRQSAMDFIVFNTAFPKSVAYNLSCIQKISVDSCFYEPKEEDSLAFHTTKLMLLLEEQRRKEIGGAETEFLENILCRLSKLTELLEQKCLVY